MEFLDFSFISLIVAKRFPLVGVCSLGKIKTSAAISSSECGGCGIITVLFLAKNSRMMYELVHYHGAKSMNGFATILCVPDELIRTIGK